MTNIPLIVSLWGQQVGLLLWDNDRDCAVFEFFPEFDALNWDIAPLIMPLNDIKRGERLYYYPQLRGNTFKGLPGLLVDSLPDDYGNQLIDEWFASKGLTGHQSTPVDRLCYIGNRGMGALSFEPSDHADGLDASSIVEIGHLTALAKDVLSKRLSFSSSLDNASERALLDILKVGTSAGGAKPKAIIAINQDMSEVRSGQVQAPVGFSYWLLKFDGLEGGRVTDNPKGIGRIEYAYYKMALDCGIKMSESRLYEEGDFAHFLTKRFDCTDTGDRLHTQTLCAMAHYDRDDRHSYEQAFQVMRRLGLPYADMEQMYRRMVFNIIARNHDDHTKNHAFILEQGGEWRLAPAYDLCFTYSSSGRWTSQHQLSANNKRDAFTRADLLAVAKQMGIKKADLLVQQVVDVVAKWPDYAVDSGVQPSHIEHIHRLLRLL